MKNLSTIWFIKEPIDIEHKEYVLLDYLKSISKNINSKNCYPILRAVSKIVKSLNEFKKNNKIERIEISKDTSTAMKVDTIAVNEGTKDEYKIIFDLIKLNKII